MIQLVLNSDLSPEQRDLIETAFASAESLTSVLNDILDFSKLESGEATLENSSLRLRDWVGETVKVRRGRGRRRLRPPLGCDYAGCTHHGCGWRWRWWWHGERRPLP